MKVFIIDDICTGTPYLIRLTLFEIPTPRNIWRWIRRLPRDEESIGPSLKLHTILRSDADRDHHDHPWSFWTLMLCGGYWEERITTSREWTQYQLGTLPGNKFIVNHPVYGHVVRTWVKPGNLRFCRAPYLHRLELKEEATWDGITFVPPRFTPAVTLVFMYPKVRDWGFQTGKGWVFWKKYLGAKEC